MSSVYIIASDGGWCKIGKARDPSTRVSQLATGHPFNLAVSHSFACKDDSEAYRVEQLAHVALADHRMKGEWFAVSADVAKDVIENIISPKSTARLCAAWQIAVLAKAMSDLAVEQLVIATAMNGEGLTEVAVTELSARLRKTADRLVTEFTDDL